MTQLRTIDAQALANINRALVGFDRIFNDRFFQGAQNGNYPPHNIVKYSEDHYGIEVAVAGFTQGEVEVNVKEGNLIITGEKLSNELPEGHTYEHQGISARRFIRTFTLADYVEVTNAVSKDGILTISLERKVPEALQPKTIAITYAN